MPSDPLDAVRKALATGRLTVAMEHLSAVWAEVRDPDVASALERLGDGLAAIREPIAPSQQGWLEREAEGNPADTAQLARDLHLGEPGSDRLKERGQLLAQRTPDPRTFAVMLERVHRLPYEGHGSMFQKILERHVDPRASFTLPPTERQWGRDGWQKRLDRAAKLAARLPAGPIPGAADLRALVDAALAGPRERWLETRAPLDDAVMADLMRAVVAGEPDARLVFADRIAEHDPDRATFIQLQLAASEGDLPARQRKALAALTKRQLDLLGPLSKAVSKSGLGVRGGFLDAANVITASDAAARELGDEPSWGTARALWAKHVAFYEGAGVSGLYSAGCAMLPDDGGWWWSHRGGQPLELPQVRGLSRGGPWPFEVLQVRSHASTADDVVAVARELRCPRLHTLAAIGQALPVALAATLGVREVVLRPHAYDLARLQEAPTVTTIHVEDVY
ncbi:MAG: hypothetical protein KC656_28690, partial [Myxococcales bacterium]|nr:hypothetical protein [Myxococcales bacterium]